MSSNSTHSTHPDHFSDTEKDTLAREGYIIVRNAVPAEVVNAAQRLIADALPKDEHQLLLPPGLTTNDKVIGLLTQSCLAPLLRREMGPFPDVISSQIAVIPPHNDLGGRPGPHVDGGWSGPIPERAEDIDMTTGRPKDPGPWYGPNDDKRGSNDGQLWMDPDRRISNGRYTTLVGVALNDHCNGLPDSIREAAMERAKNAAPIDGWPWPELTPVCLNKGDAVIALHACPHTPTPNMGPNPRMNVYFRIRRLREGNPHEGTRRVGHGVNDHPDRGYFGQFLEYPDSYDPWTTSIEKLCDHWSEWDGMQETMAKLRAG